MNHERNSHSYLLLIPALAVAISISLVDALPAASRTAKINVEEEGSTEKELDQKRYWVASSNPIPFHFPLHGFLTSLHVLGYNSY